MKLQIIKLFRLRIIWLSLNIDWINNDYREYRKRNKELLDSVIRFYNHDAHYVNGRISIIKRKCIITIWHFMFFFEFIRHVEFEY